MADTAATMTDAPAAEPAEKAAVPSDLTGDLAGDVLVEEVSIDGMCGVY
jgi:mycofactocin precursor